MSIDSAKKFVKKMQGDKEFAANVEKLGGKEERAVLITQEGFDFTLEEMTTAAS